MPITRSLAAALFTGAACSGFVAPAQADNILFSAASRCDRDAGIFEVGSVVRFNEQITLVVAGLASARQLPAGDHRLACTLGRHRIAATVKVREPSNGECMGAGHASIGRVSIDGKPDLLAWEEKPFNVRGCDNGKSLVSLAIRRYVYGGEENLSITRCEAQDWNWERGFIGLTCTTEHLR